MTTLFFRCPECKAKNRIPEDKIGQAATCGKCGTQLKTEQLRTQTPVMVTDANFADMVLKSPLPVLLEFWAPWCGPCNAIGPVMTELASAWKGKIRVAKINMDQNPLSASRFHVRSVPTFMIFDKGHMRESIAGAAPKPHLMQKMAPYL